MATRLAMCLNPLLSVATTLSSRMASTSSYSEQLITLSSLHPNKWLEGKPVTQWKDFFDKNGYLVVEHLLTEKELLVYKDIYMKMMTGEIDSAAHRHDLGSHVEQVKASDENVCQIMWPSVYVPGLSKGPMQQRALAIAKAMFGDDMAFDFDMLIAKAPKTNTPVPWHQDEAYWPNMPDKRAVSFWVAMEKTTLDNGCMWFVPGSNQRPLRPHRPAGPHAHILECGASEGEGVAVPLSPGSCTLHHGRTLHYSRGNTTDETRRGFITNFRPAAMVDWEREHGFDHGKKGINQLNHESGGEIYQGKDIHIKSRSNK